MTSKEILCSGCGATVTQWVDGIWRDETESGYCSESTTLHHPSVLPPVAIAPGPQLTPLETQLLTALKAMRSSRKSEVLIDKHFRNSLGLIPEDKREAYEIEMSAALLDQVIADQLADAAISRAEGGKQ